MKLKEFCDISAGGTPSRSNNEYWNNGNIPWLKISDLKNKYVNKCEEYITENALNNSSAKLYSKGTILYTIFATIGEVAILDFDATTNQAIAGLKIKDESLHTEYLYYYLKSLKQKMINESRGVAQNNINLSILKELDIEVPSIDKQNIIIESLSKLECLIETKKSQIVSCNNLIKSQFVEMFGDINMNSKNFEESKLSSYVKVIGGYAFKSKDFKEEGIPVLRIGNINAGYFRPKDLMFWNEDSKLENYVIYPGDVVMSLTGTVGKDDYGNICIMRNDYEKYYLNQRNAKLILNDELDKCYITYALRIPEIKKRLTGISRGVRQANISNKDIENLVIPIPPTELQNKFAQIVEQIDKQKFEFENSLKKLEELQASLMQEYFG